MSNGVGSVLEHDNLLFHGPDWDFGTIQRIHDVFLSRR